MARAPETTGAAAARALARLRWARGGAVYAMMAFWLQMSFMKLSVATFNMAVTVLGAMVLWMASGALLGHCLFWIYRRHRTYLLPPVGHS